MLLGIIRKCIKCRSMSMIGSKNAIVSGLKCNHKFSLHYQRYVGATYNFILSVNSYGTIWIVATFRLIIFSYPDWMISD